MKSERLANVIWTIHLLIVLSVIFIPFFGNEKLLKTYIIIVPFLFFHWATNNDTCFLTVLESNLRGLDKKDTFFQRIMEPIYIVPNDAIGMASKFITMFLYYICLYRVGIINKKIFNNIKI